MILSIYRKRKTTGYLLATTSLGGITAAASLVYTSVLLYKNLPGLDQIRKLHLVTSGIVLASLVVSISSLLTATIIEGAKGFSCFKKGGEPEDTSTGLMVIGAAALAIGSTTLLALLTGQVPLFAKAVQTSPTPTMIAGLVLACLPVAMVLISLVGWGIGANVEKASGYSYSCGNRSYSPPSTQFQSGGYHTSGNRGFGQESTN